MTKKRLDVLVAEKGLAPSREKAKALIMAGIVYVDGEREDKAGTTFPETAQIEVRGKTLRYVSRGGLKLEKALRVFSISPKDQVCLDIGSSTGGFTDCMLQNGARHVYAIDVGRGQLDWSLRQDPRVTSMEKTNIRYVKPEDLPEKADFATVDVSFISLKKVLIPVRDLLKEDGMCVCLIKPQFEAGREKVGRHGVVRDRSVHESVITSVCAYAEEIGLHPSALDYSPIRGPEGNIEYLVRLEKSGRGAQKPGEDGSSPGGQAAGEEGLLPGEQLPEEEGGRADGSHAETRPSAVDSRLIHEVVARSHADLDAGNSAG